MSELQVGAGNNNVNTFLQKKIKNDRLMSVRSRDQFFATVCPRLLGEFGLTSRDLPSNTLITIFISNLQIAGLAQFWTLISTSAADNPH